MADSLDAVLAAPSRLAELVTVQPGAVVSRTLVRTPGGSLTLFAFDGGQGLSEHTTPHEATVVVLDGRARITIAGTAHDVSAGGILHLPAGVPHALDAEEPFKMLLVMLKSGV